MIWRWMLIPVLVICFGHLSYAQLDTGPLKQYVLSPDMARATGITREKEVKEYYRLTNYNYSWIGEDNVYSRQILLKLLEDAAKAGLNRQDYQSEFMDSFITGR